jgi:hypothetical protein
MANEEGNIYFLFAGLQPSETGVFSSTTDTASPAFECGIDLSQSQPYPKSVATQGRIESASQIIAQAYSVPGSASPI